jgi:hypothetical protein
VGKILLILVILALVGAWHVTAKAILVLPEPISCKFEPLGHDMGHLFIPALVGSWHVAGDTLCFFLSSKS